VRFRYLFSGPEGDTPVHSDLLDQPFRTSPFQVHPFMTLGDYFDAIRGFLLQDDAAALRTASRGHPGLSPERIADVSIRSEKHGALYHLASVDVDTPEDSVRFALNTAVDKDIHPQLRSEYALLRSLNRAYTLSFLPTPRFLGGTAVRSAEGVEYLSMMLTEWLEGYHEWHLGVYGETEGICIWDNENGLRWATESEYYEIFRQASRILAYYYDFPGSRQIYPWHHGAGDFVVNTSGTRVEVRLSTARDYQSIMDRIGAHDADPMMALFYFFLNLSIKMRLDRLEGTGDPVWAGVRCVQATVHGFFESLYDLEDAGRHPPGLAAELLALMVSFHPGELKDVLHSLLPLYETEAEDDFALIQDRVEVHVKELTEALQDFRQSSPAPAS